MMVSKTPKRRRLKTYSSTSKRTFRVYPDKVLDELAGIGRKLNVGENGLRLDSEEEKNSHLAKLIEGKESVNMWKYKYRNGVGQVNQQGDDELSYEGRNINKNNNPIVDLENRNAQVVIPHQYSKTTKHHTKSTHTAESKSQRLKENNRSDGRKPLGKKTKNFYLPNTEERASIATSQAVIPRKGPLLEPPTPRPPPPERKCWTTESSHAYGDDGNNGYDGQLVDMIVPNRKSHVVSVGDFDAVLDENDGVAASWASLHGVGAVVTNSKKVPDKKGRKKDKGHRITAQKYASSSFDALISDSSILIESVSKEGRMFGLEDDVDELSLPIGNYSVHYNSQDQTVITEHPWARETGVEKSVDGLESGFLLEDPIDQSTPRPGRDKSKQTYKQNIEGSQHLAPEETSNLEGKKKLGVVLWLEQAENLACETNLEIENGKKERD